MFWIYVILAVAAIIILPTVATIMTYAIVFVFGVAIKLLKDAFVVTLAVGAILGLLVGGISCALGVALFLVVAKVVVSIRE